MHTPPSRHHAFTIIEFLAVLAVVVVLVGILLPTLGSRRDGRGSMNVVAQSNLRSLNTGAMNYASDNDELLFSFTWKAGENYLLSGRPRPAYDTQGAAALQAQNILQRSTGRIHDDTRIGVSSPQLPHLRYSHLVLLDYLTDRQPEPIAASPFDKNLIDWQEHPLAYLDEDSTFPYAKGLPTKAGYDMDPTWTDPSIVQLWPFASSYQVVPNAWLSDTNPQYTPSPNSPHHMIFQAQPDTPLGGRKLTEVAFPSQKVFMYEEFDHFTNAKAKAKAPLYASDPNARINLAFFDGSVRQELVSDANSAQDPNNPHAVWQQTYLPLDTFPAPRGGLGDTTPLDLRFRWTKKGLAGIDYGG